MPFELNALETRILGCLLEKERLTPEVYPLSLNGLATACNQSTNRDPVTAYDEKTIEEGLTSLREKRLAVMVSGAGLRVSKYRHHLPEQCPLDAAQSALICVLLLRGPQTAGELRLRTERMHPFPSLEAVEQTLNALAAEDKGLVVLLPQRPGQKERRYRQLLSSASVADESSPESFASESGPTARPLVERVAALEAETAALKAELQQLREELAGFRRQFE